MKVACVAESEQQARRFTDHLAKGYDIKERKQEAQNTNIYTLEENFESIEGMLYLMEKITGIDPKIKSSKSEVVKARKAACYLLYYRFGISHQKAGKLLNYGSTSASFMICRELGTIEVKGIPMELAIRKVLKSLCEKSS